MAVPPVATNPALAAYAEAARLKHAGVDNAGQSSAPKFSQLLAETVTDAVEASRTSEATSIQAASGKVDLQDVVEAVNAAEISLQTVVSIRDRVISAYQEIMRMPI